MTNPTQRSTWGERNKHGEWQPKQLPDAPALWKLPWKPKAAFLHLFGKDGYLSTTNLLFALMATVSWMYFTPAMERMQTFRLGWIAQIYLRNAVLLLIVAGGLHFWLYMRKSMGTTYKYVDKWLAKDDKRFLFNNQTYDNIFWNYASGVVIWTAFEAVTLWMYANGRLPYISFREHPVYGVLMMVGVIYLRAIHFYVVHRISHWRPLYDCSHYLHHRNINIGPWSGLSMHPIEHLIYFSGIFLHWIIPSHPVHAIFHAMNAGLAPAPGHTQGFTSWRLAVRKRPKPWGRITTSTTCTIVTSRVTTGTLLSR